MPGSGRLTRLTAKKDSDRMAQLFGEEEDVPNWARLLLSEIQGVKETCTTRFDNLDKAIVQLKKDSKATSQRINNAEKRISLVEDEVNSQGKGIKDLSKNVKALQEKVLDLEARNRRNNLIIIGLPEGKEAGGMFPLLDKILRHILRRNDTDPVPEIERAHRALRPIPDPGRPPQHIFIRFLRWSNRDEVLKTLAAAKGKLTWDGHDLRIFQDLPMEIQRQRESYKELRSALRQRNLRYGFLYPARLIVTINEETFIFKEHKEAEKVLKEKRPDLFEK